MGGLDAGDEVKLSRNETMGGGFGFLTKKYTKDGEFNAEAQRRRGARRGHKTF